MTPPFAGFPAGKPRTFSLPTGVITDLLPLIDDVYELKVTLFAFYAVQQREGHFRYLRHADFAGHEPLMASLHQDPDRLDAALERAVQRGTLLRAEVALASGTEALYFINAEPGRAAIEQIEAGAWKPDADEHPVEVLPERPNIYRLYEEKIGPLTPFIAEHLRDAEQEYPAGWVADAIHIAAERNAQRWNYIQSVLERWKKEGKRDEIASRPDERSERDGTRYVSGKYADFIDH